MQYRCCTRDSRESHRSRKLLKRQKVARSRGNSLSADYSPAFLQHTDGFSTGYVHLLTVNRIVFDRSRLACFIICSTIFSTKIASRQQALLHHCYRKFVWIFNRRARVFTSHARSRRGVLFFSGRVLSGWQSEKWRKRLRKESVKSILKKYVLRLEYFATVIVTFDANARQHERRISRQMGNCNFNQHISHHAHRQHSDPVCPLC